MSIKVQLKHSAVKDKAPVAADLSNGELALNINDQSPAAYIKDSAGNIVKIAGKGAIGGTDATTTDKGIVQLADATAITAGTAGRVVDAAQLKAATFWDRTSTELSPTNAGDDVFTSGDVKVGGTTAAPLIYLKANGNIEIGTSRQIRLSPLGIITADRASAASDADTLINARIAGVEKFRVTRAAAYIGTTLVTGSSGNVENANITLNTDGSSQFAGDMKIGGTLPASPKISLNANGNATFAGNINVLGAVSRVYADNTAAKAAGLADGDFYRKADGTLMIVFT